MNIRKKLNACLLGIGLMGLASTASAGGNVIINRPFFPGYYPPPFAGYIPVAPPYGYGGYYPSYYSPNPALQNPLSPSNPAVLNYYMNGAPIPRGAVAPDPRFYSGGGDYYLY